MIRKISVCVWVLIIGILLTACGGNKSMTTEGETVALDSMADAEQTISAESEASRAVFEGTTDFFTANGIEILKGSYFEFTHSTVTTDDEWTIIDVTLSIEISQSAPESLDDGYVQTVAVIDSVESFEGYIYYWCTVYDKYTGLTLEWPVSSYSSADGSIQHSDVVVVTVNGVEYDCQVIIDDGEHLPFTITVIHPQEYDGVVFEIGGLDAEYITVAKNMDWTAEYRLLDKFPCYEPVYFALD